MTLAPLSCTSGRLDSENTPWVSRLNPFPAEQGLSTKPNSRLCWRYIECSPDLPGVFPTATTSPGTLFNPFQPSADHPSAKIRLCIFSRRDVQAASTAHPRPQKSSSRIFPPPTYPHSTSPFPNPSARLGTARADSAACPSCWPTVSDSC